MITICPRIVLFSSSKSEGISCFLVSFNTVTSSEELQFATSSTNVYLSGISRAKSLILMMMN